ncbi:MAG: rubredoxin [Methanomassiliicoccales archaeon]|nr:rubredoxin [Methanomassiliicoccales archaeon]
MPRYKCNVCHVFEYEESQGDPANGIKPGSKPDDLAGDWRCWICGADKDHLMPVVERTPEELEKNIACPICGRTHSVAEYLHEQEMQTYLAPWHRKSDETEGHMAEIDKISLTGKSLNEPMRTTAQVISWNDILILGAQLASIPLNKDEAVNTRTVIGPGARQPLVVETPLIVTHMSYGALSREVKIALAKGSMAVGTAIGSGEGGCLEGVITNASNYIFEYVPNKYSVTEDNLRRASAIEIKFGQSAKPGMGGHLPAAKVTAEIARIRKKPEGHEIISPAHFPEIMDRAGLKKVVDWLRSTSEGRPIGIKLAAGKIEDDMMIALSAEPDYITIDGRPGSTGSALKFVKDATSVPTVFALYRARKLLDEERADDVSLVITGGLRISSDFAKALAMGADAVAIGIAGLIACGCQQYRLCDTGRCPVGITTQDPKLRARLIIDYSAKRLENFLRVSTEELKEFARLTGHDDIHKMSNEDLCTVNSEISDYTNIRHA